jgi:hypothetical protein
VAPSLVRLQPHRADQVALRIAVYEMHMDPKWIQNGNVLSFLCVHETWRRAGERCWKLLASMALLGYGYRGNTYGIPRNFPQIARLSGIKILWRLKIPLKSAIDWYSRFWSPKYIYNCIYIYNHVCTMHNIYIYTYPIVVSELFRAMVVSLHSLEMRSQGSTDWVYP